MLLFESKINNTRWSRSAGHRWLARSAAGFFLVAAACGAHATSFSCAYGTNNSFGSGVANVSTVLANGKVTVGRDIPAGYRIFTHSIQVSGLVLECVNGPGNVSVQSTLVTPKPLSTWQHPNAQGKTYQTGLPGVSVVVWASNSVSNPSFDGRDAAPMTTTQAMGSGTTVWNNPNSTEPSVYAFYSFYTTGPVTPGIINGADLPTFQLSVGGLQLIRAKITGSMEITGLTCTTSDVKVPLGDHPLSLFTGVGTGSPLKGFNIALTGCPPLYGYYRGVISFSDNGNPLALRTPDRRAANRFSYRLIPTTSTLGPGVVALSPAGVGVNNATGVGIEINDSAGAKVEFNTNKQAFNDPALDSSATNYLIPFTARLVQTGTTVTPGQANGAVEFTLTYY